MKEKYTLPNGEVVTILPNDDIKKNDFYVNLKSGFMGYCHDDNDAGAMNLVRHIAFGKEELVISALGKDLTGLWVKLVPTEIQAKKIQKQYK